MFWSGVAGSGEWFRYVRWSGRSCKDPSCPNLYINSARSPGGVGPLVRDCRQQLRIARPSISLKELSVVPRDGKIVRYNALL